MYTEKDNEELVEALVTAARAAFLSLKETTQEHFYFYVYVFDEGMHPYISAWSYEALEKSIKEQQVTDEDKSWWKWDSADSPYAVYGYDEFLVKWIHCLIKGQVNYPMMNYMRLSGKCGLNLWKRL